ncbi:MAG: tol-pal system YbgF family protein [Bradymonadaceae bacterium]
MRSSLDRCLAAMFTALGCLLSGPWCLGTALAGTDRPTGNGAAESEEPTFDELVKQGTRHYRREEYEAAREAFERAYNLRKEPNLLYNIGLLNEKLGNLRTALEHYRKFVDAEGASMANRKKAQQRINVLEPMVDGSNDSRTAESTTSADPSTQSAGPEPSDRRASSLPGVLTLAGGGAALAAGGVFFGLSRRADSRFDSASSASGRRDARDDAHRRLIIADSLFAAGLVASTVGVILLATRGRPEQHSAAESTARVGAPSVVPSIGPQSVSIQLRTRF